MAAMDWSQLRFLIVDGDRAYADWARKTLARVRVPQVTIVPSASQALQVLRKDQADLVVADVRLPGMSGIDFVRWLRDPQNHAGVNVPVLITAQEVDRATLKAALEAGADGVLRKSEDAREFLRQVAAALVTRKRAIQAARRVESTPPQDPPAAKPVPAGATAPTKTPAEPSAAAKAPIEPATPPKAARPAPAAVLPRRQPAAEAPTPKPAPQRGPAPAPPEPQPAPEPQPQAVKPERQAPRKKAREWQDDPTDEPETGKQRRDDGDVDLARRDQKPKRHEAEDWQEALGESAPSAAPAAKDTPRDLTPDLKAHAEWLSSGGKAGTRAEFVDADLHGVSLEAANLSSAVLQGADLSDADCRDVNFQGADLRRARLCNANVTNGNLGVARLRHADLSRTNLEGANLRGCDLAGATLTGAIMGESDLSGANLLSTNLAGADLSGARGLTQTQIARTLTDSATRLPGGLRRPQQGN